MQDRGQRKILEGVVVSDKMDQTVVVEMTQKIRHAKYGKVIFRKKKFYAHNEGNVAKAGDTVSIVETRPLSKLKRWRVVTSPAVGEGL